MFWFKKKTVLEKLILLTDFLVPGKRMGAFLPAFIEGSVSFIVNVWTILILYQ